jgi:hypothetical protein
LCLRPLQPLAQALDVLIVRLVLFLVQFQQRPKTSTRRFFSITRSARSNSRTAALYRAFVAAGLWLLFAVFIVVGFFSCLLVC